MGTVTIAAPEELAAQLDSSHVSEEGARLIALELFRKERVNIGRAAELCAMRLAGFMEFSAHRGLPPLSYTADDLEADRQTVELPGL